MTPELNELIERLKRERDSMLLASRSLAKKFDETGAPSFKRMASRAVERAGQIQKEIQKLKTGPGTT
jgi:hypothetical protein